MSRLAALLIAASLASAAGTPAFACMKPDINGAAYFATDSTTLLDTEANKALFDWLTEFTANADGASVSISARERSSLGSARVQAVVAEFVRRGIDPAILRPEQAPGVWIPMDDTPSDPRGVDIWVDFDFDYSCGFKPPPPRPPTGPPAGPILPMPEIHVDD